MKLHKNFFVIILLLIAATQIQAQIETQEPVMKIKAYRMPTIRDYNTWDLGAHFGLTYASTDIAGSNMGFGSNQMSFGVDVTKFFSHNFALQARMLTGGLKGEDSDKPLFQYHTKINYDLSLNAVVQIGNISFLSHFPDLAIYGSIGVGVMKYSPTVSIDGGTTERDGIYSQYSQPYEFTDYTSTSDLVIPYGIGIKYRISDKFTLSGEYSLRTTKSDKLDGFFKLLSANDHYSTLNFGIVFHLGNRGKMIEWENPVQVMYNDILEMKEKVDHLTLDSDEDGVADLYDKEPDTRIGAKVYGNGVSIDTDGDGVPDISDSDPYSNMKAKVEASGKTIETAAPANTTKDSDGDGIPDHLDVEPYSVRGAKVDANGKEIPEMTDERKRDSDGDGIADYMDSEPYSPKGVKVDVYGREVKTPADGNTGVVTVPSTEVITETDAASKVSNFNSATSPAPMYLPSVFFASGQDLVELRYYNELASVALSMHNNPGLNLRIIGNCDTKGSVTFNIALGKRRAEAVKNFLVKNFKVNPARLFTETVGKAGTIEGVGSISRRVDIKVKE